MNKTLSMLLALPILVSIISTNASAKTINMTSSNTIDLVSKVQMFASSKAVQTSTKPTYLVKREVISNDVSFTIGYINNEGKFIPTKYSSAGDFYEGLSLVYEGDFNARTGYYSYIDTTGKVAIKLSPDIEIATPFTNGMASVKVKNKGYGFIDKSGNMVIPPIYDPCTGGPGGYSWIKPYEFSSNGLCRVQKNGKWGYINKAGKVVVPIQYTSAEDFSDGAALVRGGDLPGYKIIDSSGNVTGSIKDDIFLESNQKFNNGLMRVTDRLHKYGFIDKTGKIVIPATYSYAEPFSEGLSIVSKDNKFGAIDTKGKLVIPFSEGLLRSFHEGLAVKYKTIDKYGGQLMGYIDKAGKVVIPEKYSLGSDFQNGYAQVGIKTAGAEYPKLGYIDKKGNLIYLRK